MANRYRIDRETGKTLSLKCPCGYVKHDVMHLGTVLGEWQGTNKPLNYCGGLWIVDETGQSVSCKLCGKTSKEMSFNCAFCGKVTLIPVNFKEASTSGRVTIVQMSVHQTIVFS